jgi:hypothetical protein
LPLLSLREKATFLFSWYICIRLRIFMYRRRKNSGQNENFQLSSSWTGWLEENGSLEAAKLYRLRSMVFPCIGAAEHQAVAAAFASHEFCPITPNIYDALC